MHLSRFILPGERAGNTNRPRPGTRGQGNFCKWQGEATKASAAHPAGTLRYRPSSSPLRSRNARFLLRKEVIQPHLPVRLPCYDFTPIIDPTLDGSLPCGLGHRLRVKPTLVV